MNILCLKDIIEEEQVIPDKTKTELKIDLQKTGHKNDTQRDDTLLKSVILIIKRDIQTINQERILGNFTLSIFSFSFYYCKYNL